MKLLLKPRQTMKQARASEQLDLDATQIHRVIRNNPGISKRAIADRTDLSLGRVTGVIDRIKRGETGYIRVEHGPVKARGGPNAGQVVRGWHAMDRKRHHVVMDHADEHSALVEVGVRRSRLVRYVQAQGISGADEVVGLLEERLGLSVAAMSQEDLEAFEELLTEELEEEAPHEV